MTVVGRGLAWSGMYAGRIRPTRITAPDRVRGCSGGAGDACEALVVGYLAQTEIRVAPSLAGAVEVEVVVVVVAVVADRARTGNWSRSPSSQENGEMARSSSSSEPPSIFYNLLPYIFLAQPHRCSSLSTLLDWPPTSSAALPTLSLALLCSS